MLDIGCRAFSPSLSFPSHPNPFSLPLESAASSAKFPNFSISSVIKWKQAPCLAISIVKKPFRASPASPTISATTASLSVTDPVLSTSGARLCCRLRRRVARRTRRSAARRRGSKELRALLSQMRVRNAKDLIPLPLKMSQSQAHVYSSYPSLLFSTQAPVKGRKPLLLSSWCSSQLLLLAQLSSYLDFPNVG